MNTDQTNPNAKDGDESWEGLAEDLFGINFSHNATDEEPVLPEDDIDNEALSSEKSTKPETSDAELELQVHEKPEDLSTDAAGKHESQRDEGAKDSFWNGLESWDWEKNRGLGDDDQPNQSEKTPLQLGSGTPKSQQSRPTSSELASAAADSHAQAKLADADEFGSGILEKNETPIVSEPEPSVQTITETTAVEESVRITPNEVARTEPTETAEAAPTKGPRRRRRGSRTRESEPERTSDGAESGSANDFAAGLFEEDVPVKAVEEEQEPDLQGDKPLRRKRRRRSSKRRRKGETAPVAVPSTSAEDTSTAPDSFEKVSTTTDVTGSDETESDETEEVSWSEEPSSSAASTYRDIPTWEEAISYLLDPSLIGRKHGEFDDDSTSPSKKESSRTAKSTKSSSRRGRRRR